MVINSIVEPLPQRLRSEIQWRKFKLKHTRKEDFAVPTATRVPQSFLTVFRCLCSLYTTAWVVLDAITQKDIPSWFTNVSSMAMLFQVLYFLIGGMLAEVALFHNLNKFIVLRRSWSESRALSQSANTLETSASYSSNLDNASRYTIDGQRPSTASHPEESRRRVSRTLRIPDIGWYRKSFWFIYYCALDLTLVTSLASLIDNPNIMTNVDNLSGQIKFHRHFILPILLLIDVCINAIPINLFHVIYPLLLSSIYVIIALFHWGYGDERLMIAPDSPCTHLPCVKHIAMTLLLGVPVAHLFVYTLSTAKTMLCMWSNSKSSLEAKSGSLHVPCRDFPQPNGPLAVINKSNFV